MGEPRDKTSHSADRSPEPRSGAGDRGGDAHSRESHSTSTYDRHDDQGNTIGRTTMDTRESPINDTTKITFTYKDLEGKDAGRDTWNSSDTKNGHRESEIRSYDKDGNLKGGSKSDSWRDGHDHMHRNSESRYTQNGDHKDEFTKKDTETWKNRDGSTHVKEKESQSWMDKDGKFHQTQKVSESATGKNGSETSSSKETHAVTDKDGQKSTTITDTTTKKGADGKEHSTSYTTGPTTMSK